MILSEDEWESQPRQKVSHNFLPSLSLYCRLTELLSCRLDTAAERVLHTPVEERDAPRGARQKQRRRRRGRYI